MPRKLDRLELIQEGQVFPPREAGPKDTALARRSLNDQRRSLARWVAALSLAVSSVALVAQSGAPAPYQPPRTPWGDPDLQGVWPTTDFLGTPFQRPAEFGTRTTLTEAEFAARADQARRQIETDNAEFEVETADISNAGEVGSATSPPPHWLERGKATRQASFVVDPPDGRVPELTAAGRQRRAALQETRRARGPADSWEDRSLWDRCLTRGLIGSILPTVYNAGNEIIQAPGYVVLRNEMIHEARVIPLDGRPHVGSASALTWGIRVGAGTATRWWCARRT